MKKEMELPETVKAFNAELAEMLTMKPPVSSSKMKDITKAGMRAHKYYKHVVLSVEKLIQKSKPDYKLSGVYVIDAIVRQSRHQNTPEKDNYGPRFQNSLTTTVTNLFKCSRSDQVKISRTLKLWEMNGVFSVEVVAKCLSLTDSSIRNEGIKLAESVKASNPAKANSKANPAKTELLKQKQELEEQQKQIMAQQKQLARQQEALLKQSSTLNLSTIPPILGNLLQFGANKSGDAIPGFGNDKETVNKVKQLLDDFDYGDDDEIKVPAKQDKNGAKTPPVKGQVHELNTPSPTAPIHNDSLYSSPARKEEEKHRKGDKRSSSKKRHRSRSRERDGVKSKDKSKERSKSDKKEKKKVEDKKSRSRGKRSRSASPSHVKEKKMKEEERYSKLECVTILSTTIWIGNLRKTVTKDDIATLMKKYGKTDSINMVPPRGCVYVCVKDRDTAREALKDWKGLKLHGAACKIAWAPGKGCKDYKHYWDVENGVTYIPHREFERLKFSSLEEGGVIDPESLPAGYTRREEAAPDEAEPEGPGSILEKLLVSMRGKKETEDTPFSQFLPTDKPNIAQQEQNVSAKLDQLDMLTIPSKSTPSDLEEDSIVHLLNSKDYTLSEAISGSHSPAASETCMSPLENLLPEGVTLEEVQEANKTIEPKVEPNEHVYSPVPQMTPEVKPAETTISPVKTPTTLSLTPVKTPSHDTGDHTPTAETPDTPGKDKKAINLQTYLKRKRDDDPEDEIKEETPKGDVRAETPPPADHGDDLLEWVTNQEEEQIVKDEEAKRGSSNSSVKRGGSSSKELSDKENEDDGIRSPESSPVDSLLEEKLASPSVLKEDTPPLKRSPKSSSSRSSPTKKAKLSKIINSPTVTSSDAVNKYSPNKPLDSSLEQLKLDYDASDNDIGEKKDKMKSSVSSKVHAKKEKKHKVKSKKKKKASSRHMEEELEEDIRRLEFLKAELEKEEKKERREEKRKEREKREKRIASRSPNRHSKEKKRKEKRVRR